MRLRITPKIVIRVSTVLTLSGSLVYASVFSGRYGVNNGGGRHVVSTGSASDRVALAADSKDRKFQYCGPVGSTTPRGLPAGGPRPAPGTDIILKVAQTVDD